MRALATALAILLATILGLVRALAVPGVAPGTAPTETFSAERAMTHVREIARGPHPVGSAEHARVREYLLGELARLDVAADVQTTTAIGTRYAVAGRVRNVVARLRGEESGQAVLLVAHYDAVPAAPGAGDDASGSATLLETLRALRAGPRPRHDVIALFADAEEAGLLGAAAFAREHPWAKDVAVTMNVEARGTRGPSLMFETGAGNLDVARALRGVPQARATSLSTAVYRRLPNDTDLSELMVLDRPALNFAFIGGVDRYHTSQDDVEHLDPRSVQHHGDQLLAMTRTFANGPLPRPTTGDAVFFDLPLVGLVVYPESWALPLAGVALALTIAAAALVRRREAKWLRGIILGATGTILAAVVAAVIGLIVPIALARMHAAIGSGRVDVSGTYAAAIALVAFAIAAATYRLARRWAEPRALHAGALALWAILSLMVAIALPGGSFLFTWPLLLVALAFVFVQLRPGVGFGNWAHAIAGLFAVVVIVPIVYLMGAVALGLGQGGVVIAAFTALAAWLLAFAFVLLGDRSWRPTVAGAGAALALVLLGAATNRTDGDHPVGTWFGYGIDADSGRAWVTGSAQSGGAIRWVQSELSAMTSGQPLTSVPVWLGRHFNSAPAVEAPAIQAVGATVTIVADSTAGAERVVTLRIVPPPGTLAVDMGADSVIRSSVDGHPVDTSRFRFAMRRWAMEYFAPDPGGFTVTLALPAGERPVVEILSRRGRLPDIEGLRAPSRPDGAVPVQRGDMTFVFQRVGL